MNLTSKKASFIILSMTSLVCSRVSFVFLDDSEGPNLLIVVGMAAIIYTVSVTISSLLPWINPQKILMTILVQILFATGFAFLAK